MGVYDISLNSLIEDCMKFGFERRILIIPNCSEDHKILMKELDKINRRYAIDNPNNLSEQDGCYVIDFREINLIQ